MKLSIVIVNYNVEYFLEQCLHSVFDSVVDFNFDVFVVDNNSVDGSVEMVRSKFDQVKLIANKKNVGFSRANNQAIRESKAEYVLLLNPDTLIEHDTLQRVIDFMDAHPEGGGLGVKMVDGKGNFLPESKRGLPTPTAAFYKIFGLSALFPRSKRFSSYHLGHLDKDKVHEIDVLSGAFMLMRMKTLEEVGLLDEDFFMYGEDIDLSYRIQQGGYKNFYYPLTRIIHYKGESTKKDSLNYVFVFYRAMIIFARKHFSHRNARFFSFLINLAIVFKASLSLTASFAKRIIIPLIDFALIYAGLFAFAAYWGPHFAEQTYQYPPLFLYFIIPDYIMIVLLSVYYNGGYEKPVKALKLLKGHAFGILLVFVVYALMPESYRFSRALLLFAALYMPVVSILWRGLSSSRNFLGVEWAAQARKKVIIVGSDEETLRVENLMDKTTLNLEISSRLIPNSENLDKIEEIVKINKANELIFCAKDLNSTKIIDLMTSLQHLDIDYKIAPPESLFIIGSNSINTAGDIYFQQLNTINQNENKRIKRLFDIVASSFLIAIFPLSFWRFSKPFQYLFNLILVFISKKSMVGFDLIVDDEVKLPKLKIGILHPSDGLKINDLSKNQTNRVNLIYARDYHFLNDLLILWRGFKKLDRKH